MQILVGTMAITLLLAMAWAISRINRRAGFGWFGSVLPFATLVTAILIFMFQTPLGYPATERTSTMVMSVVMLIWALHIIVIASRTWPALFDDKDEGVRS